MEYEIILKKNTGTKEEEKRRGKRKEKMKEKTTLHLAAMGIYLLRLLEQKIGLGILRRTVTGPHVGVFIVRIMLC